MLYNEILGSLLTVILITIPFLLMDLAAGYGFNMTYYPSGIYNFWTVAIYLHTTRYYSGSLGLG